MARRGTKGASSAIGWGLLILLGLILAVVNAVAQFVQENWALVRGALIVGGIAFVLLWALKIFKRHSSTEILKNVSVSNPALDQNGGPSAQAKREPSFGSSPSRTLRAAAATWIRPGESVQVQGIAISGGLFYLGEITPGNSINTSQYVINAKLPISTTSADVQGASMPYWPSYASISPNARRALLQWMADGRLDPGYGIGHVFLFFYGLEHRLFVESARNDARALIAEVTRLLSIYGKSNSFRSYAARFLFAARVFANIPIPPPDPTIERDGASEISDLVRLYLGHVLATTDTLSADDALTWVLAIPDVYFRTPAVRCFNELKALWHVRFAKAYPNGLRVSIPKKTLQLRYRAASGAFEVNLLREDEKYPDVGSIQGPINALKTLVQACTDELEAYSRFIGRHPGQKPSIQAALLLPNDLQIDSEADPVCRFSHQLAEIFGTRVSANMPMRKLLQIGGFETPKNGKLSASVSDQLNEVLDRIGFAIVPDRRYGGWVPQPDDEIVLFKADHGGPINPDRPTYRAMKAEIEVAILAAAADGPPSNEDFDSIKRIIAGVEDLSRIERARLLAYTVTLFKSPPKQERVIRQLSELTAVERKAIAKAAIAVAGTDRHLDATKVRFLEKLHKTLGLPKEEVYSELHRTGKIADEPVAVSTEKRTAGIPILRPKDQGIVIDPARLAQVRENTDAVSKILGQIFSDSETSNEQAKPIVVNGTKSKSPLDGLDVAHAELVESIEMRGEIARKEFEDRAKSLRLLPDGAFETINEWSFDHFNEPLLDDGDRITIPAHLRDRIAEMRETPS